MDSQGLRPQKSNIKPTTKFHIKNVYCNKQLNNELRTIKKREQGCAKLIGKIN